MNVLPLLCLAVLLAGCSNTRETFVPAPVVPVPAHLLADCPLPVIPDELTYGGAILLLTDAMKTIADCNHDKRAIREFEQMRASGAESNKGNVL
ncbi:peptidase [Morganella morganii]|uniref:Peptidase n=2 Tax=Morganella morganii TaxID=582 RepID=A0A8I0U7P7_MORMO|nr:peptidase [Morganella morganii]MBE8611788.1 peptidase [Morganella morganii]